MFQKTPIADLLIYEPKVFRDERGFLYESYNHRQFLDAGLSYNFVQDIRSFSKKGILRGLHFQTGSAAQAKLVSVVHGHIYDVAVDLRPNSITFGKHFGIHLSSTNEKIQSILIPRGFAHGFVVLSETADFFYKVDNFYDKDADAGIAYNDPDIAIEWPINVTEVILSEKDKKLPSLKDYLKSKDQL